MCKKRGVISRREPGKTKLRRFILTTVVALCWRVADKPHPPHVTSKYREMSFSFNPGKLPGNTSLDWMTKEHVPFNLKLVRSYCRQIFYTLVDTRCICILSFPYATLLLFFFFFFLQLLFHDVNFINQLLLSFFVTNRYTYLTPQRLPRSSLFHSCLFFPPTQFRTGLVSFVAYVSTPPLSPDHRHTVKSISCFVFFNPIRW